ncbi:ribosome small subunit-dependent GTPase A [Basilea psittacipulmonis]|uniref:Small ribosomal subunit biogenesis GTPase RsgA n=1 Tax=Basilea psittacipulmonis DSM 24701 TaxID=1072685 RepID=A0A077DHX1_9BURK|nr:ribosome small subunit-dependent GTPase A [Basilea psittacipulmonis]AIL33137.1 GTPase RsgA [Basilea psittacipulmonis DSM 24701]
MKGLVTAAHGRHYEVELENGKHYRCYPKGKKSIVCVGDHVQVNVQNEQQAWIEEILPRKNLLYRSDKMRSRQFAANIDQLIIVIATEPDFSLDLLGRAVTAAWAEHIDPIILLNKCDLQEKVDRCLEKIFFYTQHVPLIKLSALNTQEVEALLLPKLEHKTSILLGQSGMGKSTILNALVPDANCQTQEISQALGTGKHTTTHSTLYHLPHHRGQIIDSPGFQAFGLFHLSHEQILQGFPEFNEYLKDCRFYNCTHQKEPHCGVRQALAEGKIDPERYDLYLRLLADIQVSFD